MQPPRLGKVQLRIMQLLWDRGHATAREITDALADEKLAHSTIQTLLRKLEVKGAVRHELEERTFVFYPVSQQQEVTSSAAQDLLDRVFQGSVYGLVSHLLKNERVSREELDRLRRLLDEEANR